MKDSNAPPWELMARYLSGEINSTEKRALHDWLHSRPEHQALFDKTQRDWNVRDRAADRFRPDADAAWARLKQRLPAAASPDPVVRTMPAAAPAPGEVSRSMWASGSWLQMAAMLLLAVGLGYLVRTFLDGQRSGRAGAPTAQAETGTGLLEHRTLDRSKAEATLPDGSRVWLNQNSSLRYAADFGKGQREVLLEGEAYFEVRKAAGKTFTILSNDARTQVLGTSFNVRSYKQEGATTVTVFTGRVSFAKANGTEEVFLTPGYQGLLTQRGSIEKDTALNRNVLSWHEDQLVFENTPLPQVIEKLEHHFHTSIDATDQRLLQCRFTGTFEHPELENVLQVLAASLNGSIKEQPGGFLLNGTGCQ